MNAPVEQPAKGQPMRASWGAAVTDRLNSLCSMAPSGMLARDGMTGSGAQPLPRNRREAPPSAAALPWTFSAEKDPDSGEFVGGWTNGICQLGYNLIFGTPDLVAAGTHAGIAEIDGCDQTADGDYYLTLDSESGTVKLIVEGEEDPEEEEEDPGEGEEDPGEEEEVPTVRFFVGTVETVTENEGTENETTRKVQTSGSHYNPVIYIYE